MADAPTSSDDTAAPELLTLTADIVVAHVANNRLSASELPALIASVHGALSGLGKEVVATPSDEPEQAVGAVSARKSLADPTRIISMLDGKPYTTLKRHLSARGLTPDQYRAKFGLKPDYPMVAPAYAEKRSSMAKALGLDRKAAGTAQATNSTVEAAVTEPVANAPKRVRKKLSAVFADAKGHLGLGD